MKQIAISEIKDQFSKFLRLAEKEEVEQNPPASFFKGGETPGSSYSPFSKGGWGDLKVTSLEAVGRVNGI
jgi:hypothetical protein